MGDGQFGMSAGNIIMHDGVHLSKRLCVKKLAVFVTNIDILY